MDMQASKTQNPFLEECLRQGLDPARTTAFQLDRNGSPQWREFRQPHRVARQDVAA